jgi:hypothetical protein
VVWGEQLDVKHIGLTGRGDVTDRAVAGYLAKYATKSTEATGHAATRINGDSIADYDPDGDHLARLITACWRIGRPTPTPASLTRRPVDHRQAGDREAPVDTPSECPVCGIPTRYAGCPKCTTDGHRRLRVKAANRRRPAGYTRLRRWAHMLGFGGHFLTKARRYSTTFQTLRDTRINHRRREDQVVERLGPIRAVDHLDDDTTLVIGLLTFAGAGWRTNGDALLANTSADLARHRQTAGCEELAHEVSTNAASVVVAAA